VAGTSIGAVNASIVTARYRDRDHGTKALEDFWQSLTVQSFPFPLLAGGNPSWNAVWTSLLFGNSRLFQPTVPFWTFMAPVTWALFTNFYDTASMERTLAGYFHAIGPRQAQPRLIITAVDLQTIRSVAFDSWDIAVTPHHVVATCSLLRQASQQLGSMAINIGMAGCGATHPSRTCWPACRNLVLPALKQ
jgi:predicted acylesterase/phospholipase RssA